MELTEQDRAALDKPYFTPVVEQDGLIVADEPQADAQSTEVTPVVKAEPESDDDGKVPYSRFKKFHDAAADAKAEAEYWRGKAEALETKVVPITDTIDVPDYWKKMYGDEKSDNWTLVQEAWKVQQQANNAMFEQARKEALDAVRNERGQEEEALKDNMQTIDQNLEQLTDTLGRDLTEKEQSAVLDIVDEYTPKDDDGNYLGAVIPFDKAWEIYELKNTAAKAPKAQARDQVASLTGTASQGDTSITEKDANFNPLDWNAWRKRI